MVMEPGEGDEDDEMGEGGLPPGVIAVELTPDDEAAIGRLEALGFDRSACIEAYLRCARAARVLLCVCICVCVGVGSEGMLHGIWLPASPRD